MSTLRKILVPGALLFTAALVLLISYSLPSLASVFSMAVAAGGKLQKLIQLAALILVFNAVIFGIRQYAKETVRCHFFPIAIALSSAFLIIGYRSVLGAGIGLNPGSNGLAVQSGILHNAMDNYSYGAWITQAKLGQFTFFDLYTVEPHKPLYFNFLFLTLGSVARWLHAPSLPVLIVGGIAASTVLVLLAFYIPIKAGLPERAAKWSCALAAFSSGVSLTLNLIARQFGAKTPPGADLRYQDAILFSSYYSYPYNTLSFCLLAILVLLIVVYDQRKLRAGSRFFPLFLMAVSVCALNFTHPYEGPLLLLAYGSYCTLYLFIHREDRSSGRLWMLLILAACTGFATAYNLWVANQPVWHNFAQLSLSLHARRSFWALGYGLALPASLIGAWMAYRKAQFEKIRWMGTIPILVFLLLIVLNIKQTKLFSGAYFFMCILAGLCIDGLQDRIQKIGSTFIRKLALFSATMVVPFFFFNSLLILLFFLNPLVYHPGLPAAAKAIRLHSSSQNPLILCDSESGMTLPLLAGARVYAGHIYLTPDFYGKRALLTSAGFDLPTEAQPREAYFKSFMSLLQSAPFEFVVVKKTRPAYVFASRIKQLDLIDCFQDTCLFATPFFEKESELEMQR